MANVGQSRDPVAEFECRVASQFAALRKAAKETGCLLKPAQMPARSYGRGGMEHEVWHDQPGKRYWKATFPGKSGCGPFGFYTPAGYLRRMRLTNLIFGDDIRFEGILVRKEGLSVVTSQPYIQPHPGRFIPTEEEIAECLAAFGFTLSDDSGAWERSDGVILGDTHDRNFIRAPDERVYAIDVQPKLQPGFPWEGVTAAA